MAKFIFTKNYNAALQRIEEFIFSTSQSIGAVEAFLIGHDETLLFIARNPNTPAYHPETGDQSWNFTDGRYRIFIKTVEQNSGLKIFLLDIIDNRESNIQIYPGNSIPTYSEE